LITNGKSTELFPILGGRLLKIYDNKYPWGIYVSNPWREAIEAPD